MAENMIKPEFIAGNIPIQRFLYDTPDRAREVYQGLDADVQMQMADIYRAAFGGYPWYEKFRCLSCGQYTASEDGCPRCGSSDMCEAYPRDELMADYFPQMVGEFTPGLLMLATAPQGELVGFSTGGFTTPADLVDIKYGGNRDILRSITTQGRLIAGDPMFYDNETCIWPDLQKRGVGKQLSQDRIKAAISMDAAYICGRSVNLKWLALKERQLTAAGYDFTCFTPDGDTYEVEGIARRFYIARNIRN